VGADCDVCDGWRWLRVDVPVGHPRFGELDPCVCWDKHNVEERTGRLLRYSNLKGLIAITFNSLDPRGHSVNKGDQQLFNEAFESSVNFAETLKGWFILTGPSGAGKTTLAAAIANRVIERGMAVLFMVVPDLLDHLRNSYGNTATESFDYIFEQVRDAPLLVLDGLGVQAATVWAQEKLFQVLNYRYNVGLPTVLSISGSVTDLDERLYTRINDSSLSRVVRLGSRDQSSSRLLGLPPKPLLDEMDLDSFYVEGAEGTTVNQRDTLEAAYYATRSFARDPRNDWLVISGSTGVGKTHLAVAVVNHRLDAEADVFYTTVLDLLDHLRAAYAPGSDASYDQRFERLRSVPLLVLDDLGSQSSTSWAEEKLYQLLVHRHDSRLPTMITMDSAVELRPAILSRLRDQRFVTDIPIRAPDYRDVGRIAPRHTDADV
jgi:DNA replication protein DnaC